MRAQAGERGVVQIAGFGAGHGVGAGNQIDVLHRPPETFAIDGEQIARGVFEQRIVTGFQQPAPRLRRRQVGHGGVGGEDGFLRAGDAQQLVRGDDIAEMRAAVDHVVPGPFQPRRFRRKTAQMEIGDQPGDDGRQREIFSGIAGKTAHDTRGNQQGHGANYPTGAQAHGRRAAAIGGGEQDGDVVRVFFHRHSHHRHAGGRAQAQRGVVFAVRQRAPFLQTYLATDGLGNVRQAFRPGQYGVLRVVAGAKIVQTSEGRYFVCALPVVVPTAIVEIPAQRGRMQPLRVQPAGEGLRIECFARGVRRRQRQRNGKTFAAIAPARTFQACDEGEKAPRVGVRRFRQQAVLPAVLVIQARFGGEDQVGFAVGRCVTFHAVLQNAQRVQQLAHLRALARGQRQIVRASGGGDFAIGTGGVVAVALGTFGEQKVALPVARQMPRCA